jgi:sugar/nucleoside kinase (ribokinase family)
LDNQKSFGYNLSAVFLIMFNLEEVKFALKHANIIFSNEDEIDAFYNAEIKEACEDTPVRRLAAARHIAQMGAEDDKRERMVIIT